jgi:hypothetical protein
MDNVDAHPPPLLAFVPLALVLADAPPPPHSLHVLLVRWCGHMLAPRTPCMCS